MRFLGMGRNGNEMENEMSNWPGMERSNTAGFFWCQKQRT